jgi:ferrous iron transport protein B
LRPDLIESICKEINTENPYFALQLAHQHETLKFLTPAQSDRIEELEKEHFPFAKSTGYRNHCPL